MNMVKEKIDKKEPVYACYVDFRKAFDLIDRDLLLVRLNEMGIKGRLLVTAQALYKETTSSRCLNGHVSCFINPLLTEIDKCESA